jgi:class 3 adenylate cyclase/tetratricopeptide (TPR) repeat protein
MSVPAVGGALDSEFVATCPSCGKDLPGAFPFCPFCGAQLSDEPRAPAHEERKVVTVLFCDLVGFTSRSEQLDPEDVRALLAPYWQRLREELERFGGTVEKFIGDAVVALFGAPVAHEDDPERAVRAALAIRDWVSEESELQVRIGVNTGEALVSLGARPSEGEGMASGDVVNTAARLQSAAPVDGILVGEQTYRATERMIEYREHEPVQAKGKAEPVRVWEAVQARSRFGVDLAPAEAAALVGRDEELELLVAAFRRAVDDRLPQLVTVVGVPGIGKSRLLGELFATIDAGDRLVRWRQGRSLPYGEGVSYWALGEMVKAEAGILETDAAEETARKLAASVERLVSDRTETDWLVSMLRPLVGLAPEELSGDGRGAAFAAWRRFFEALGEDRPLVVVFEDLHWADDGLLDFVDHLVDWLTDVPVMVVGTARPELLARRPAWGGGKGNATTISLEPLSDEETARLVHALLERSVLAADVQSAVLERAGGNPLYAEEFVRMVAEGGSDDLEVPGSVQGIIAARLDALEAEDKELLQDAAVVGKVFWSGSLAAIGGRDPLDVEQRLPALERRELVRRSRRSSVAGESEYAFRHILVRDVAYGSIPRAARADRHRRAAEWIESLGRPEDQADLLAYHYLAALELSRAAGVDAGVLADSAATALLRAGERAASLNAFESAARFFEEALELGLPDADRARALLGLGVTSHRSVHPDRIQRLENARDALLAADEADAAAEACVVLAEAWWDQGKNERGRAELERARKLVEDRPATPSTARVLVEVSRYAMLADETEEAIRVGREALGIAEQLGLTELVPAALVNIGSARGNAGDEGGIADLERAIEIAQATNNPELARAYNNRGAMESHLERAIEWQLLAKEAADRLGHGPVGRFVEGQLLLTSFDIGRWDEFVEKAEEFLASSKAGAPSYNDTWLSEHMAEIHLARDQDELATVEASRCLARAREIGEPQALQPSLSTNIHLDLVLGRVERARELARELLVLLEGGATTFGLVRLALAADVLGIREDVRRVIATLPERSTTRIATSILDGDLVAAAEIQAEEGWRVGEAELRLRAAESLVAQGRRAEADVQLRQALAFYRSVGATRYVREGEALLAATA